MSKSIEFCGIGKSFPGVRALNDVSFKVNSGKICALMGENGAGKSTLLKILSGDLQPDSGYIAIDGEKLKLASPSDSIKASISVIYQETQLVSSLSVMENVFIEALPKKNGFLDKKTLKRETQKLIDQFGLNISPTDIVGTLSVAYQQMVEIMKSIRRNSDIIAFDEPTASLTESEINVLFELIHKLKEDGKIILYVSHRMGEIFKLTDEIVVLKDGQMVKSFITKETNENELITSMVGRDIGDTFAGLQRNENISDEVLLEVENLSTDDVYNVNLKLHRGEILGLAGLVGAGRTEVVRAIFGADPIISGTVKISGEAVHFKSPTDAIAAGIALCPEDRKLQGLVLRQSIAKNITMPFVKKVCKGIFVDRKLEKKLADVAVEHYAIKTPTVDKNTGELSGGNQQKVILGRWTSEKMDVKVLILDEPTKGIDVGAKAEIYQRVCDFAKAGIGVIFISSELTEVINISDRVIVMQNGQVTGTVTREEATEEKVLALAMLN